VTAFPKGDSLKYLHKSKFDLTFSSFYCLIFELKLYKMNQILIVPSNALHAHFAEIICDEIEKSALLRGTGIAKRNPDVIREKIIKGDAIIALDGENLVGFCYIQLWSEGAMLSHSGLIVAPQYRKMGFASKIKTAALNLAQEKYPKANVFGITTNLHVIKINTELGYVPTTFSEITKDENFWSQCSSCPNYDVLMRTEKKLCLCTAMIKLSKMAA
jgi:ribosomal protein S18 acetylase RimI-like enzyme